MELPELAAGELTTFELRVLPDQVSAEADVPPAALERLVGELDLLLERPYAARAVRQGRVDWIVGANALRIETLRLPDTIEAESLEVAVAPDGERSALVDGRAEEGELPAGIEAALAELERRGRDRFESFAARADKVGTDSWELTIDPL